MQSFFKTKCSWEWFWFLARSIGVFWLVCKLYNSLAHAQNLNPLPLILSTLSKEHFYNQLCTWIPRELNASVSNVYIQKRIFIVFVHIIIIKVLANVQYFYKDMRALSRRESPYPLCLVIFRTIFSRIWRVLSINGKQWISSSTVYE